MKLVFQGVPRFRDLLQELFVFWQQVIHIAGAGVGIVRVLEVEVVVSGLDLVDGNTPGLLVFHAGLEAVFFLAPPGFEGSNSSMRMGLPLL